MELKIYIRQTQFNAVVNDPQHGMYIGDPIIFVGTNSSNLHPVNGTVPKHEWEDVTEYVSNLNKIKLTWTSERDSSGNVTTDRLNPQRSASNSVVFEDFAYSYIKEWLIENVAAPVNAIDVRIEDVSCGVYDDFMIKSSQITWCESAESCSFSVTIQQKEQSYQCIQRTLISDNWQRWFPPNGQGGKKHPRFVYCNEARPNMTLIGQWWLSTIIFTIIYLLTPVVNTVMAIVNLVKLVWLLIKSVFGGKKPKFTWFDPGEIAKSYYLESSGCGRMYPAPLIRDYISNVCRKCGVEVDGITAPIFFSKTLKIDTSFDKEVKTRDNPYYNACYLSPQVERGIRIHEHLFGSKRDLTTYWIEANAPALSLDMFLDQIKGLFNAEWRISNVNGKPTLFFWRKDWFTNGEYLYDFTDPGDRAKILQGVCFSWNDVNMPTYIRGIYNLDSQDACGNEARTYMNDMVSVASKTNNRGFDGSRDITVQEIGATRFRLDGVSRDYIADAMQVVMNGAILTPTIPAIFKEIVAKVIKAFADYALLLSDETTSLGKVLIWDTSSGVEYAKVIRTKKTAPTTISGLPVPQINPTYNESGKAWHVAHPPKTKVTGSNLSPGSEPEGQYQVKMTPFSAKLYDMPALLCNYPMFMQSGFRDNLWDWFLWIDDPNVNPKMNMSWSAKIELCCEDQKRLGLFGDGSNVKLLSRVKVPNGYYSDGIITEITASYDNEDRVGKYIEIKGTL